MFLFKTSPGNIKYELINESSSSQQQQLPLVKKKFGWCFLAIIAILLLIPIILLLGNSPSSAVEKKENDLNNSELEEENSNENMQDSEEEDPCKQSLLSKRPGRENSMGVHFLHIQKAGGTSIQLEMTKWAKKESIPALEQVYGGEYWEAKNQVRMNHIGLLQGHRGYGYSKDLYMEPLYVIVVLREPVSRFISFFDYTFDNHLMPREVWARDITLEEVMKSYRKTREKCFSCLLPGGVASVSDKTIHQRLSMQMQFLCGYDCVVWDKNQLHNRLDKGKHLANMPFKYSLEEMYEKAVTNLKKCHSVGVLTHLDDIIPQIRMHIDWIPPDFTSWPKDNAKKNKASKLSKEMTAYLKDLLRLETELYQLAVQLAQNKTKTAKRCLLKKELIGNV